MRRRTYQIPDRVEVGFTFLLTILAAEVAAGAWLLALLLWPPVQ